MFPEFSKNNNQVAKTHHKQKQFKKTLGGMGVYSNYLILDFHQIMSILLLQRK
jgi:hypothetical protein